MSYPRAKISESLQLNCEWTEVFRRAAKRARTSGQLSDVRDRLVVDATDYTLELHRSFVELCESGKPATAVALGRLLIEAALTACYLLHLKDVDYARRLEEGESYLPLTRTIVEFLSNVPVIGRYVANLELSPFNKLTHGDMQQLSRRSLDGWPNTFGSDELRAFLVMADSLMLAALDSFGHAIKDAALRDAVRELNIAAAVRAGLTLPDEIPISPAPDREAGDAAP